MLEQYDGVSLVYSAEEPGNGVFINSDADGTFFSDRYLLEISCNKMSFIPSDWPFEGMDKPLGDENDLDDLDIREYFSSFEELQVFFQKLTSKVFDCAEEIAEYLDGIASETDGIENAYFMSSVNEFTLE